MVVLNAPLHRGHMQQTGANGAAAVDCGRRAIGHWPVKSSSAAPPPRMRPFFTPAK